MARAAASSSSSSTRPTHTRKKRPRPSSLLLAALLPITITGRGTHYPLGVCDANCMLSPLPCPGQTCGPLSPTACNRYLAPTTDPGSDARPWTYCTNDFAAPCTDDRLGCPRCALRQIAARACTPAHRCTPRYDRGYVVVRSAEANAQTPPGQLCFTDSHYLLVPTRPCVGVESPDPQCAGRPAEKYWGYAWDEALARGFGAADGALAGLPWGVLLNPKNARSQHQAHFRFAPFKPNATDDSPCNDVIFNFLQQQAFSTDIKQPTFTWGERAALFVSVFVPIPERQQQPIDGRAIATRVRPFKRAAALAKAAMPLTMYGVQITPFQQPVATNPTKRGFAAAAAAGWGGNVNVTGVVVTAFFNVRCTVLMDATVTDVSPENCQGVCAVWGVNSVSAAGAVDPGSDEALFGLFE